MVPGHRWCPQTKHAVEEWQTNSGRVADSVFASYAGIPSPDNSEELLPLPKGAAKDNQRFFASETTGLRSLVKGAWRTMDAVFKRSGVVGADPHRFRHTLASELLGKDESIEGVAGILGDSAAAVRRYYAKWTPEFQMLGG